MLLYVVKRVGLALVTLVLLSLIIFFAAQVLPGLMLTVRVRPDPGPTAPALPIPVRITQAQTARPGRAERNPSAAKAAGSPFHHQQRHAPRRRCAAK